MPRKPWIKTFSRPHTLQRISFLWPFYRGEVVQDNTIKVNELLILPSLGKFDYYMHEDEWLGCLSQVADYLMKKDAAWVEEEFSKVTAEYEKAAFGLIDEDLIKWDNDKLLDWFEKYSETYRGFAFYSFDWIVHINFSKAYR